MAKPINSFKKKNQYQGLDRIDVFVDTDYRDDPHSKYFQIL